MSDAPLHNQTAIVVGGSSGIGYAIAKAAVAQGASVWVVGRSQAKLGRAEAELSGQVQTASVDMGDHDAVREFFNRFEDTSVDHLAITAATAVQGAFADVEIDAVERMFASKFFGPYGILQAALPKLRQGASVTLFSGIFSRRPAPGTSGLAAVNAAIEGLTRALALELGGRVRVNAISPGLTQTEAYAGMPESDRQAMFAGAAAALPARKVGDPDEVAAGAIFLMRNAFVTGHVLDIDGGAAIA